MDGRSGSVTIANAGTLGKGLMSDKPTLDYQSPQDRDGARKSSERLPAGWFILMLIVGAVPLVMGLAWLYTFHATDHRGHHRIVMIPLGLVCVVVGGWVVVYSLIKLRSR
jgi:hypothetical protein